MPQLRNHIDTFPLEHLFRRMELAGFVLSPADRLRALQVLGGPGKSCLQQPQRLRELLAPVLVRSEAEQQKFYEIFDQYYHDLAAPVDWDALAPRRPMRSYWRWLLLLGAVAILGYGYYKISTRRPVAEELAVFIDGPTSGSPGDTIRWNNQSRFSGDTTQLRWRWSYVNPATGKAEATDSTQYNWTFVVPPIDSGTYIRDVTLSVYHQGLDSTFEARQGFAVFCNTPPAVLGIGGEKQLEAGQKANFSLLADEKDFQVVGDKVMGKAANWRYEWDFGDGQPTKNGYAASHTFEQNGQYTVQLTVTDTSQAAYCAAVVTLDVKVGIEQAFLPFAQLHEDELTRLAVWGWGYYLLLGLLGAGLVFHWVRWIVLRRRDDDDAADTSPVDKALHARFAHSDKAPYYIPIQEQRGKILFSPAQVRLADALRLRQSGIRREIDVPKTLQSTIDLGGFPAVRYRYLTQPSEYLCLIDEQSRNDHQARLFRHIADNLRAQDVHLEVFYYRRQLTRCWNATHPLGLTLDQLHRHYGQHKLIVMGDLHDLVDPHALDTPALRPLAANTLRQWRQRLLLTPVPPVSWGYREKLIARVFSVFPADTQGLSAAALHLENDGELLPDGYAFDRWKTNQTATRQDAETEHRNWRRWRDIQTYLAAYGTDVERWFRALAVFPLPTWELTVAIGHELGIPVTLDKLLVLARVPVMQAERWDERLRQDMLAGLNPSDEHTARYVVQRELQAVKVITAGSHAHHDLETALAIQDFALNPYGEDERTAIRFLLDSGQLSPAQEAELGQVVNKTAPTKHTKGGMSKVAEEPRKLTLTEWLTQDETETDQAPEAPVANPSTWDMRLAAFLTLAYIVMLLVGWQLGGTPQLYKWVFGDEQPASNHQPLRDYLLVKETTVVDSVIILNNMGVNQAQVGGYSDTTAARYFRSAMEKANSALYGEGHAFRGNPISYALANANLGRLYYNHAAYFLQQYLRDSLGQAVLPEALGVLEKAYISDSVALDVLHARGVIHYYLGSPEDSIMAYYVPLDEEGYFDAIDYAPNLSTLLGRARSRILETSISEAGDRVLNLTVNYYVDNTIDKATYLYMFTEGKGELPPSQELVPGNAPGNAVFRIEPPRKNPGSSTAFYVQLRRRATGAIIDSREIVYTHNWALPKIRNEKTTTNSRTPRIPTPTRPPTDAPQQVQQQTYRIYGQVVDIASRKPLGGVSVRLTDGSATTQTDDEGRFTLELQAEPTDNASRTLAVTLAGFSSYSSQHRGVQWMEQTQKEPLDIRLAREVPRPAMRAVGAGSFARPLNDGAGGKRKPEMQTISVSAFSMATYELTFAEYDLFCEATERNKPDDQGWGRGNRPVIRVTWADAVAYCNWLSEQHEYTPYYNIGAGGKDGQPRVSINAGANGYRLPTEAEWEYAARGGTRQQDPDALYAGGDTKTPLSQLGWFDDNSNGRTQPVGQLRANNSGLYDMSGNVWEWCWDYYNGYDKRVTQNPIGPNEGSHRIIRGGAWIQQADDCRVDIRQYRRPEEQTIYMGFRLARTP